MYDRYCIIIMMMMRMMMRMGSRKNAKFGLVASHLRCRRDEDQADKVGEWQAVMMKGGSGR
jgi:ribosomal protein S16